MRFELGPEEGGIRLDKFLSSRMPDWTRSQLQRLNRRGSVLVNRGKEKDGYRLREGEIIEVQLPEAFEAKWLDSELIEPEPAPLKVHYEDPFFAIVEKPAGIVVHPGAGNRKGTLVHALRARFPLLSNVGGVGRPGIVHRLDRWTSGLIIVAKTNTAHSRLSKSFQRRDVKKTYIAAVHGRMKKELGEINLTVGRHPTKRTRMVAGIATGREAHSIYRVRETISGFSRLEISIETGRTHQIRVHLAAIGHPVIGDITYGEKLHQTFARKWGSFDRYFLHAAMLAFPHPETTEWLEFDSPIPAELDRLWKRLADRA